jgi:ATP-dependent DNA ligase
MHWHNPGPGRRATGFIEPCLPTNGHTVPAGPQWAYEIKHDGFRFVCRRELDRVRVFSRRCHEWTDQGYALFGIVLSAAARPQNAAEICGRCSRSAGA